MVILGAGIAGLCTAIALHHKGFRNVELFERRAEPSDQGAGLVLWPNAIHILHKLDLWGEVKREGEPVSGMQRWSMGGDFLNELDISRIEKAMGYKSLAVSRAGLQSIFLKKVKEINVPLRYGHKISAIREVDLQENTVVSFENGLCISADVIVGADGRMNSRARKFVCGDSTPVWQGFVNFTGLIQHSSSLRLNNKILDFWGCGERFGIVPLADNRYYWAACKATSQDSGPSGPFSTEVKDYLQGVFSDWPPVVGQVISETPEAAIRRIRVYDHDPPEKWYRQNVCLAGDAAHAALPTSGQGACQAAEDAWHFAETLSRAEGDIQLAFPEFQKIRQPKTTAITKGARSFARALFNSDPDFCIRRNENAKKADMNMQLKGIVKIWSEGLPK